MATSKIRRKQPRSKTRRPQPKRPTILDLVEGVTPEDLEEIDHLIRVQQGEIELLRVHLALLRCERVAKYVKLHGLPKDKSLSHGATATWSPIEKALATCKLPAGWIRDFGTERLKPDSVQDSAGK